jgi:hypothetical protein
VPDLDSNAIMSPKKPYYFNDFWRRTGAVKVDPSKVNLRERSPYSKPIHQHFHQLPKDTRKKTMKPIEDINAIQFFLDLA